LFHVHHSNSVSLLADRLIDHLAARLANPMATRTIVVPHPEMGRWFSRRMAVRAGICANLEFELPAACLWRLIAERNPDMPAENPLNSEVMTLKLLALLMDRPPSQLAAHVEGKDTLALLSLARRLAGLFDQYLVYRHQWILDWEAGGGRSWQAALWRRVAPAGEWHWARALAWLFDQGYKRVPSQAATGPMNVLALPGLAPEFLRAFAALGQSAEITFYHWNPCAEYWGDISPLRKASSAPTEYLEIGNPLLASMGCRLRDHFDLLLELETSNEQEFVARSGTSSLAGLQSDILQLQSPSAGNKRSESSPYSIQLHACHSRRREVEVCHDLLIDLFERKPDLKPDEVQVLAPDISLYAADIESIFGAAKVPVKLPFRIIGAKKQPEGAAGTCLLLLTSLLEPISNLDLLELLTHVSLARRFGIDADGRVLISRWLAEAGAFGETDPNARDDGKFSWDAAAQRLLLDSMLEDSRWQAGRLRAAGPVGGSDLDLLEALLVLVDSLTREQLAAERNRSLDSWCDWAQHVLDHFLRLDAQGEYERQLFSSAIARLRKRARVSGFSVSVEARLFLQLLEPELESLGARSQGQQGGITFSSATGQRLIPAQVIHVLGLNDGEFPAAEAASELDLISASPRRGDGSRRQDDRQIFLEWLCTAGELLSLSYQGQDIRDNSERTPSPLVGELLDYLGIDTGHSAPNGLLVRHPTQAFSRRYGRHDGLFTYKSELAVEGDQDEAPGFLQEPLPEVELEIIELVDLARFLENPCRQFLNRRLGAWLDAGDQPLENLAPVAIGPLSAFLLKQDLVEQDLAGWTRAERENWAQGNVAIPDTPLGHAAVSNMAWKSSRIAQDVQTRVAQSEASCVQGSLRLGADSLNGKVDDIHGNSRVIYRPGKAKPAVYLRLWVEHLFWSAMSESGDTDLTSVVVCEDQDVVLGPIQNPRQHLQQLLDRYKAGQSRLMPLIPQASKAFAEKFPKGQPYALKAATRVLRGNDRVRGDAADVHVARMLQAGLDLDQDFMETALAIWNPLLEHLQ
jgi:exodeoxyribonuclease V gamma subunit